MHNADKAIIFITGASRSGTTLMSFMLRRHDYICGLKELQFFGEFWNPSNQRLPNSAALQNAAATLYARQQDGILHGKADARHDKKAAEVIEAISNATNGVHPAEVFAHVVHDIASDQQKPIPCEQTPRNIFYAEQLLELYPNAQFIHMVRDPQAVLASQKRRWQRRKMSNGAKKIPLRQTIRVWVNYHPYTIAKLWNKATKEALRLKDHPRFHAVHFEDLLLAPEETLHALCAKLNIEYQANMLDVQQINSSHQSNRAKENIGVQTDAIHAWKDVLSPTERQIISKRCASLMKATGYLADQSLQKTEILQKLAYIVHLAGVALLNPKRALIQLRALSGTQSSY